MSSQRLWLAELCTAFQTFLDSGQFADRQPLKSKLQNLCTSFCFKKIHFQLAATGQVSLNSLTSLERFLGQSTEFEIPPIKINRLQCSCCTEFIFFGHKMTVILLLSNVHIEYSQKCTVCFLSCWNWYVMWPGAAWPDLCTVKNSCSSKHFSMGYCVDLFFFSSAIITPD